MNQGIHMTRVYMGTDSHSVTGDMILTHTTVRHLTSRVECLRHKIFMDNFFPSPRLFDDLDRRKINSCGTVRPNRRHMPLDFGPKQLKLKRGDVRVKTRGGLTALVWKGRREVYMLTNMDPPPAGNICDDSNRPVKPHIMERYYQHMGYVNNSDRMANSYSMSWCTFKWTTKLFFHFLDLTVFNSWILLLHVGLNISTEISGSFWWGIWVRKLERAKIAHPQIGWKTKFGCKRCFATRQSP